MLKPVRPGRAVLSKMCYDNDPKLTSSGQTSSWGREKTRPIDSTNIRTRMIPKIDPRLPVCSWSSGLLIQPMSETLETIKTKTGSFVAWMRKLKQECAWEGNVTHSQLHAKIAPIYQDEKGQSLGPRAMYPLPNNLSHNSPGHLCGLLWLKGMVEHSQQFRAKKKCRG